MNKAELTDKLAERTGLPVAKARECIDAIFDSDPAIGLIAAELLAGGKVAISGFGTFEARARKAEAQAPERSPCSSCRGASSSQTSASVLSSRTASSKLRTARSSDERSRYLSQSRRHMRAWPAWPAASQGRRRATRA